MIEVRDLKLLDVWRASANIRDADQRECLAGTGDFLETRMTRVWDYLKYKRGAFDADGHLLCAWGVDPDSVDPRVGHVWLFATNRAVPKAWAIHRHLKPQLGKIKAMYPVLTCWADSRNVEHHKWLRWLGFEEVGEHPYGLMGMPFKNFVKKG